MKKLLCVGIFYITTVITGQVGIGIADPTPGAMLDVSSTSKGFLPPRLTIIQRDNINPKPAGLIIYNLDEHCMQFWNSSAWLGDCSGTSGPGTITDLSCTTATHTGTLVVGLAASGVSSTIAYSGGNGGTHNGQTVTSTGVTGLTAKLDPGSFANGNGMLTYNITGTPTSVGTASFIINIGGKTCTLTRTVTANTPPNPDQTANCTGWQLIGFGTRYGTINGMSINATATDARATFNGAVNPTPGCGGMPGMPDSYGMAWNDGDYSRLNVKFNRKVSNIKVSIHRLDGYRTLKVTAKRNGVAVKPLLSMLGIGCNTFYVDNTNNSVQTLTPGDEHYYKGMFNIGGEWFDEIEITGTNRFSPPMVWKEGSANFRLCIGNTQ